ncbi:hypothetical protein [Paracoccus pacificus]|uniref:Uncharacterized protein n=1 Tax=Paracoccus pacificus TaxID=1463598 RepID=A0ABW4R9Q9_9RHOB
MRAKGWSPRLLVGTALSKDQFSFVLGELEYDDPFSAIITYDGNFPQPWSRIDVQREVVDLLYADEKDVLLALSNEGDVYTIRGGQVDWSKIPGAGVLSDDAEGYGATHTLLRRGETSFVFGAGRQIYERTGEAAWNVISADKSGSDGYQPESFGDAILLGDGDMLIEAVSLPAQPRAGNLLDHPDYRPDLTPERLVDLMDQMNAAGSGGPRRQFVYRFDGRTLDRVDVPEDIVIRDLYQDPNKNIWIVGVDGLILKGNTGGNFDRVDFHGDRETLISAVWFSDKLIVASDYSLHGFDGHIMTRIKPVLNDPFINRNTPTPNGLQVVDGIMFYFDYKHGVCRWDGEIWDWIDIPEALLERKFEGLR